MSAVAHKPGHAGETNFVKVSNARRTILVDDSFWPNRYEPGEWGVRLGGDRMHPTRWDGAHQGRYMTPDEADELAEHLRRCAAWARAQQCLEALDAR